MDPPRITRHTLPNGLRIVFHHDPGLPLVAVNLWYHVGSKNERRGRTGLAHLFEHMLFQGSENVPENGHFQYVQQVGGVANGSTWYDRTNYFETLPSQHLGLGLWLESDRMGHLLPAMTEEKLENQRSVVMNERRQRVDNQPYGRAFERLHELLYPAEHPYHWPVIGYMDDIAAATLDDVRQFFNVYYAPNNAVLTLAGSFDEDHALDQVADYFGQIARGPDQPALEHRDAVAEGLRREVLADRVQLGRIYLAFRVPAFGSDPWYAGSLLSAILSAGKSSRLYQDLVYSRRIAHTVSSYLFPTEECATFTLIATAKPGVELATLERALLEHLDAAAATPVDDDELARVRNTLLAAHYSELQTLDRRADLLSEFTTYFDRPEDLWLQSDRYAQITSADLQRFSGDFCRPSQRAQIDVVPHEL